MGAHFESQVANTVRSLPKVFRALIVSSLKCSREPFGLLPTIPEKGSLFMAVKLFVGNLAQETTSTEIRDLFSAVGVVESCQLIANRETGRSKGFGFVEMNSREAADAAKEKFNGHNLHGKTLKVSEAEPRIEK
jgi:RNA recognition motif-containing protein